jgi:hypothetical protein
MDARQNRSRAHRILARSHVITEQNHALPVASIGCNAPNQSAIIGLHCLTDSHPCGTIINPRD